MNEAMEDCKKETGFVLIPFGLQHHGADGGSDALTANDRRNLLIAQRRADDVHSGGRRDLGKLSLVRKGQVPFSDTLEEGLELSGCHSHLEPNWILAIGAPGVGHNLG